jgi:hypothetical protein
MKIVGPILYAAFAAAIIGGPGYALSNIHPSKPLVGISKSEASNSKQPVRHDVVSDRDRRPVWIMPTREYNLPVPSVKLKSQAMEPVKKGQAKHLANKSVSKRQLSPPSSRTTMSYAEEPTPNSQFGANGWRD